MLKDNEISMIKETIGKYKIPAKHKNYIFYSSKGWNDSDARFIMYIYGGAFLKITVQQNKISCNTFDKRYCKYFQSTERGEQIRKELADANRYKKGINVLEKWNMDVWNEVCEAFKKWAETSPQYERMRQTMISHLNGEQNNEFSIFDMEENVLLPSGLNGELDMAAVRFEKNGKPVISFIEYKCTEAALNPRNKSNLVKHYKDMKLYCDLDCYKKKFIDIYNQKQRFLKRATSEADAADFRSEIVLLFSHITWNNTSKTDCTKKVKASSLRRELDRLHNDDNDVFDKTVAIKILIIENEKSILSANNYMSIDEAINYIDAKLKK